MPWKRIGWVALWGLLHAVSKLAKAAADALETRAWPSPDEEDEG